MYVCMFVADVGPGRREGNPDRPGCKVFCALARSGRGVGRKGLGRDRSMREQGSAVATAIAFAAMNATSVSGGILTCCV